MKRKLLVTVVVVCMAIFLAACGLAASDADTTADTDTAADTDAAADKGTAQKDTEAAEAASDAVDAVTADASGEAYNIGVLIRTFSDTYTTTVRNYMEQYLQDAGCTYEVMDANDSQATQNEQLESFLSKGMDGIIVQTVNVSASANILASCVDANVPVVFFNHEPDDLTLLAAEDTTIFVGTNSPEAGYMQADLFMKFWDLDAKYDRNGDGIAQCVVFQGSPESQEAFDRSQYCIEGAEDKGYKFEKLTDNYLCNWDATLAQEAMTAFLGIHEDTIEVVFCNNDSMAEGVIAALNAIGYNTGVEGDPEILVFGVDATDAGAALIENGKMQGTVKQDGDTMAKTNVELMTRFCQGMTKSDAVSDLGLQIFEGDKASVRVNYQLLTKE